ncbi:hypothetical protein V1515DRAFT_633665, partial [Lipomyces mesembrius]
NSFCDERLIVGVSSINLGELSKGFEYALLSYHRDREALAEYQASKEHQGVISTYTLPHKEDVFRFDFEADAEDEYMCQMVEKGILERLTPTSSENSSVNIWALIESPKCLLLKELQYHYCLLQRKSM